MVAIKTVDPTPPFEYGSHVRIATPTTQAKYGMTDGSVCGFRTVESEPLAHELGLRLGSVLVLVEDSSGRAVEIPSTELELI